MKLIYPSTPASGEKKHQTSLPPPMTVTAVLILSAMIWLSGCAIGPVRDRVDVSDTLRERTGHALRPDGTSGEEEALPGDMTLEDGLTADEAVAVALWNNARFQADLVKLGFARADLVEAGLLRNPILSLLFPVGPKQFEATLSLPVELLWQRPKRVAAARINASQVADSLIQSGLDLARDVLVAFSDFSLARRKADLTGRIEDNFRETAAIASARLEAGDISGLEESAVRLEYSRRRQDAVLASRDARLAEERLRFLLGLRSYSGTLVPDPDPLDMDMDYQIEELQKTAFAARPDLRAAELAIEAAGERLGWEKARIFDFTATLDANGEGKQGFEMGPGVQIPLPVLNTNRGRILRARAEMEAAAREYLVVRDAVAEQVRRADILFRSALETLNIFRSEFVSLAETSAEDARQAFRAGQISFLEVLDFQNRLLEVRLREVEAEASLLRAKAGLLHAAGFSPIGNAEASKEK